jgi:hypothetical protein
MGFNLRDIVRVPGGWRWVVETGLTSVRESVSPLFFFIICLSSLVFFHSTFHLLQMLLLIGVVFDDYDDDVLCHITHVCVS